MYYSTYLRSIDDYVKDDVVNSWWVENFLKWSAQFLVIVIILNEQIIFDQP